MAIREVVFLQQGLIVYYTDNTSVRASHQVSNGILRLIGLSAAQIVELQQFFAYADIDSRNADPRLSSSIAVATTGPHASSHQDGGSDEINVNGLSGVLADPQTAIKAGGALGAAVLPTAPNGALGSLANDFAFFARTITSGTAQNLSLIPTSGFLRIVQSDTTTGGGFKPIASTLTARTADDTDYAWLQHAGRKIKTGNQSNTTTTLADDTVLTFTLLSGRKYPFQVMLPFTTGAAAEGIKVTLAGSVTATNLVCDVRIASHAVTPVFTMGRITGIGGAAIGQTVAGAGNGTVEMMGTIEVSAGGTFVVRWAKNATTGGTSTTVLRGAYMTMADVA